MGAQLVLINLLNFITLHFAIEPSRKYNCTACIIYLRCGKTYTEIKENITSLYYPDRYPDSLDCQYKIDLRNAGASSVNLTFSDFSLDSGDHVEVFTISHMYYYQD